MIVNNRIISSILLIIALQKKRMNFRKVAEILRNFEANLFSTYYIILGVKVMINSEIEQKRLKVFFLIFVIVAFVGMAFTPLLDEDEGMYAEAARHMLETGDWVEIQVNGETRYDKPPLAIWMEAVSMGVLGYNEFAVRLPSFLSFLVFLYLSYTYAKRKEGDSFASGLVMILASTFFLQLLGKAALTDNLLNLTVTASFIFFERFYEGRARKYQLLFYVMLGLGFLTKGPLAWVVPGACILVFLLIRKDLKFIVKLFSLVGVGLMLFIPAFWFWPAYKASGDFLITDFFIQHNLSRFSKTMESHGGAWWYYFPVLLAFIAPFLHGLNFRFFKEFFKRENNLMSIWFLLVFILFSFSGTQLPHYLLVAYFPLIWILLKANGNKVSVLLPDQIFKIQMLFLGLPWIALRFGHHISDQYVREMLNSLHDVFDKSYYLIMFALLAVNFVFLFFYKKTGWISLLIFTMSCSLFIFSYSRLQQGFVKQTGEWLRNYEGEIYMTDHYNPSLSFYARKVIPISKDRTEKGLYFLRSDKLKNEGEILFKGGGFVLIRKEE
jgi:4-amino-4-deoxy-L-arabinose transferase-like glycosyltransferase